METGGDVQIEVKVPNPLTSTRSAGRGTHKYGGIPASVGNLYGFGNTEEPYRVLVLGCERRGTPGGTPFDHKTGEGWVAAQDGDYRDALVNKHATVIPWVMENTGGIAPHPRAVARRYARRTRGKNATDRTMYGNSRVSTRSFYTHHTQRISKNVICYDAQNIRTQAGHLKRRALLTSAGGA